MRSVVWSSLALAAMLLAGTALGQDETQTTPPTVITIRPAASPVPALRYSLLPGPDEQIPGNAAIFYHRSIEHLLDHQASPYFQDLRQKRDPKEVQAEQDAQWNWLTQPLATLPKDAVRKHLEKHAQSLHEIELGARREFCNWEFQHRDEGFNMLLLDMQEMRALARLVVLKTRMEIAEGRIDSAIHWLQTGLAMARYVNQSNNLISLLIACAITTQMAVPLEDLIQAPGAPNLYWALANLPTPFVDYMAPLEGEKHLLEKEFPQLKTIESAPWSIDQARIFSGDFQRKMDMYTGDWARTSSSSTQPDLKDFGVHLQFAAMVARAYPEAKRHLIAQGRSAAQVEAMPAIQVVAIHSYRIYEEARDDIFKWAGLPFWQGYKGMRDSERRPNAGWSNFRGGLPFTAILPAIASTYSAPARVQRRLDVAQIIEAIRLYAAGHNGSLPPNLEAITEAPVPLDPATGKSFSYKVEGSTATITALPFPGYEQIPQFNINYVLKLAR
jgi:hypothetical protein